MSNLLERKADTEGGGRYRRQGAKPPSWAISPRRGVRLTGAEMLRKMSSVPRHVPRAIHAPSPSQGASTISGRPGKAAREGLLADSLPAFRKHGCSMPKSRFQVTPQAAFGRISALRCSEGACACT